MRLTYAAEEEEGEENPVPGSSVEGSSVRSGGERLHEIRSFVNFSGFRCIYAHFDEAGVVKNFELQVATSEEEERVRNERGMLMKAYDALPDAVAELAFREGLFDRATEAAAAEAAIAVDFGRFRFPRAGDDKWKAAMRTDAAYQQLRLTTESKRARGSRPPLRMLSDFAIHDIKGQLCRLEVLSETRGAAVYVSGFVCCESEGGDEQELEAAGGSSGQYVANLGPFHSYSVAGYNSEDACVCSSPLVFLATPVAEYELGKPSDAYAPYLAPLREKMELCKRIVRSLEANPTLPYKGGLLPAIETGGGSDLSFDESYLHTHGGFVLDQLRSFDASASKGDLRITGCKAITQLGSQLGVTVPTPRSGESKEQVRSKRRCESNLKWIDEGDAAADGQTRHQQARVGKATISVGDAVELQPKVADAEGGSRFAELARVVEMRQTRDADMVCVVRRLWRREETFVNQISDDRHVFEQADGYRSAFNAKFPPSLLLPDTETVEMALGHLKCAVAVLDTSGAEESGAAEEELHVGRWRYSQRFASYTVEPPREAPAASVGSRRKRVQQASSAGGRDDGVLNILELYAGSGGLSFAERAAPVRGARLRSRWHCEWSKEETETLRKNHPESHVFHLDCEKFLDACRLWASMIAEADGGTAGAPAPKSGKGGKAKQGKKASQKAVEVLRVRGEDHRVEYECRVEAGGEPLWLADDIVPRELIAAFVVANRASLPLPENVDMVSGGPPCQGVSGFNLFRHTLDPMDDSKNRQTLVFASTCRLLSPRFVIMENVVGILMFLESYVIKHCMAHFLASSFQLRIGVCVSGTFGLPQNRARVVLFGAAEGEALPDYPAPTHQLGDVPISMMTTWMKTHLLNAPPADDDTLLRPLTLRDAFSDLPSITSTTRGFGANEPNRAPKQSTQAPHRATRYAGKTSSKEAVGPTCAYQEAARRGCAGDELHDHESFVLNEDDFDRVAALPLEPTDSKRKRVCWEDLPTKGKTRSGKPLVPAYATSYRRKEACFGRLKWSDIVPTVVCRPEPHNRPIVHPDENRILSIRENARIQAGSETLLGMARTQGGRVCEMGFVAAMVRGGCKGP